MKIIIFLIGMILGAFLSLFMQSKHTQAVIEIDHSQSDKPKWLFLLEIPPDDILKYKIIKVAIKDVTGIIRRKDADYSDPYMKKEENNE